MVILINDYILIEEPISDDIENFPILFYNNYFIVANFSVYNYYNYF